MVVRIKIRPIMFNRKIEPIMNKNVKTNKLHTQYTLKETCSYHTNVCLNVYSSAVCCGYNTSTGLQRKF